MGVWLGLVTAAACGPHPAATENTWMLGVWSGEKPGGTVSSGLCVVPRMEIREDGVLNSGSGVESTCLPIPEPGETYEYRWERRGDGEVVAQRVTDLDNGFRIIPGEDCNQIDVWRIENGKEDTVARTYYRGKVCATQNCGPGDGNCVEFAAVWCAEGDEPPPCEDAEMP